MLSRRAFLHTSLLIPAWCKAAGAAAPTCKIGACDWSIGKSSDPGAFAVARSIGVDGIMVDMGNLQNNLHLRRKDVRAIYRTESKKTGVPVSSLALGIFNQVPFHAERRTEEWLSDSIDAAADLGVNVLLLAFFNQSDFRADSKRKDVAVQKIKNVIAAAEKRGVTLGIESYLDAKGHIDIVERVKSDRLKVYMDFRNTEDAGFNAVDEFKILGKDLVCELHMKENAALLGHGSLNWKAVRDAIYSMGYIGDGWMQIESSIPEDASTVDAYRQNLSYLKQLFSK